MVDFRRCILALAVLALFAGLASAQNPQLSCATNVSSVPQLRAEGFTEQTGDITFTCTGGNPVLPGQPIPTVNISIFMTQNNITSRLLPTTAAPTASEALLLIDEPGSGIGPVPNFGIGAPQTLCPTPATGCAEVAALSGGVTVAVNAPPASQTAAGFNVFQGIVNPDGIHPRLVTFFGIPVLPPATAGFSRVLRITNIRVDATALAGGANVQPVIADIVVSNPAALPITNATPNVGFVQSGLATSISAGTGAAGPTFPCLGVAGAVNTVTNLNFKELFGTAFKPRVDPQTNATFTNQNVPGATYNSESGFILNGGPIGLADFGTRLKAVFHGVTGVTVSLTNTNNVGVGAPQAVLVASEAGVDPIGGPTPGTAIITANADGTFTAVWEVISVSPSSLDTLTFQATTTGGGAATAVNMSFAPTTASAAGVLASATLTIPRFADFSGTGTPLTVTASSVCKTILLYPFVTDVTGFDTGIAIANTSSDPFLTAHQHGTCTLNWFAAAGTVNPPPITTPDVASGNQFLMVMSGTPALANFTGYMIASCNFQYAHGFAFISDPGIRNFAEGYLALVIPDPGLNTVNGRAASPNAQAPPGSGEGVDH